MKTGHKPTAMRRTGLHAITWKVLRAILAVECLAWLVFGIAFPAQSTTGSMRVILMALMILNGITFGILAFLAKRENRFAKWMILLLLLGNTVLTLTDQMGFFDYAILAINLIAMACFVLAVLPGRARPTSPHP